MLDTSMDITKKLNKNPWKDFPTSTFPSVSFFQSVSQDDVCPRTHKRLELGNFFTRPCFGKNNHCLDIMWVFFTDIIFTPKWMIFLLQEPLFSFWLYNASLHYVILNLLRGTVCSWLLIQVFPRHSLGHMRNSCASEKCIRRVCSTFVVALAFKCSSLFSAST